jgi:DNA-binding transcriptional ArsR family regulator
MVPELNSTEQSGEDQLSLVFGALAHPARRHILAQLANGDASVAELAQPFRITPRAVSKHLSVLERAGLITRAKDVQRHPSHLHTAALRQAHQWIDTYRALWEQRFDNIDTLLKRVQDGGRSGANKRRRPRR